MQIKSVSRLPYDGLCVLNLWGCLLLFLSSVDWLLPFLDTFMDSGGFHEDLAVEEGSIRVKADQIDPSREICLDAIFESENELSLNRKS